MEGRWEEGKGGVSGGVTGGIHAGAARLQQVPLSAPLLVPTITHPIMSCSSDFDPSYWLKWISFLFLVVWQIKTTGGMFR